MTHGITTYHAKQLLGQYGLNVIEDTSKTSLFTMLAQQLASFLTILLIIAAALSFFIGEAFDGGLIVTIIILNGAFGVYQQYKAETAIAALKRLSVSTVRVIRDGKEQEIESIYVVPGDIVLIEEGNKIPADAQVILSHALEINEAALTGESIPTAKEKKDAVYMGTIVAKGRGKVLITHTGMDTKFGKIAEKLSSVKAIKTPLQNKITHLSEIVGIGGILLSLVVFFLSSMQGNGYFPSFLLAISLAVAIVPEGLPAVMTIILSIGVKHMAKRRAIVRKLTAIEVLGNTTLIATDKTGTLTQNNMHVKEIWMDNTITPVSHISKKNRDGKLLLLDSVLCSTASLVDVHDAAGNKVLGDPTEGALLLMAERRGIDIQNTRDEWELLDEIPFDSVTRRMSVVVLQDNKMLFSKGAPESILRVASHIQDGESIRKLTDKDKQAIEKQLKRWAQQGLRILAMGYKEIKNNDHLVARLKARSKHGDEGLPPFKEGLIFLGMTALHDPARDEVPSAIKRARKAGIEVVMITGDNEKTAESIGISIGLVHKGDIILKGEQIDELSDKELLDMLPHVRIFARTSPFHKSRIVSLYQQLGEIVTVTGDGVNDAIALKTADVGVAMGKIGTDVARETADMVIMDDNFATIVNAVEEGRNIVLRLNHSIKYLLTGNLSEGLALVGGLALGLPPILLPIQLLYINLISDGLPALAFAFSPATADVMHHAPSKSTTILQPKDYRYIIPVGMVVTFFVLSSYVFHPTRAGAQTAVFSTLALIQAMIFADIWLSQRKGNTSLKKYVSYMFVLAVGVPVVFQYILVTVPFIANIFHINTLSFGRFMLYLGFSTGLYVILWLYRRYVSIASTKRAIAVM